MSDVTPRPTPDRDGPLSRPASRRRRRLVIALGVAAIVAALVLVLGRDGDGGPPRVTAQTQSGVATEVNASSTAIAFVRDGATAARGYVIAGAMWQDCPGSAPGSTCGSAWHEGSEPSCLEPMARQPQPVDIGLVRWANPDGLGSTNVVWLRCR